MFYPQHPETIRKDVTSMLGRVKREPIGGKVRGVISPHAGYMYSGFTAAHGFAHLQGSSYSTVVVVSPSHREYFDGISVYGGDGYSTPLGTVTIDKRLREKLLQHCAYVSVSELGHRDEHAVEVQLPFLQFVLPGFAFVPVVIGDQKREYCFALGKALASVLADEDFLLVASTDLSHYYDGEMAERLDNVFREDVCKFDYEKLMTDLETGKTEACGGGPTVAVMFALHELGIRKIEVLHHCNSGDVTGDTHRVVGYLSAIAHA
jgi:hypothetical protein